MQIKKRHLLVIVIVVGILLRLWVATFGHNFDLDSYKIVGEIVSRGGNVYAETTRYNYGPIWLTVVGILYSLTKNFANSFEIFRFSITILLTLVDLGITYLIYKKFGAKFAMLFFLNPISIIISGFHSQFDNLAILIAAVSALLIDTNQDISKDKNSLWGLFVLGISITVKHIFWLFPLWIAIKAKGWRNKIIALAIPIITFIVSFVPFWATGKDGIINNVFMYRSFPNQPFWYFELPEFIKLFISPFALFVLVLVVSGFIFRKKNEFQSFLLYSVVTIIFASGIANQYLAIPMLFIALNLNPVFILYVIFATIHLLIDGAGLNIAVLQGVFPDRLFGYNVLILILFVGFIYYFFREQIINIVNKIIIWIKKEIVIQLKNLKIGKLSN